MTLRPETGALVAFCIRAGSHECSDDNCWWNYCIVGEYKNTWTEIVVPVRTLNGPWAYAEADWVRPAVFTFTGPQRRLWRSP
jgi:hypothetical protein